MSTTIVENPSDTGRSRTLPEVCVIATVRNEEEYLEAALDSVAQQTYQGAFSIVVSVGPSRDNTYGIAHEYALHDKRVTIVDNPHGAIPHGLNIALANCPDSAQIIVRFDGHTRLPDTYIENMVDTLIRTGADNVGGIMKPVGKSDLERAIAQAMSHPLGIGPAPFHVGGVEGPEETAYLGTFRKTALDRVGHYDEYFERAEDWELNFRIRESGGLIWFRPDIQVEYQPRSSIKALARQFGRTGQWRREVIRRNAKTASLRYLAPPTAVLALIAGTLVGLLGVITTTPWLLIGFMAPVGYAALVCVGGLWAGRTLPVRSRFVLPLVLATMHMSWGIGFLCGRKTAVQSAHNQ
ncbi:glycosyltransferase [Timonella sp. A28]|uniref:glycosyltransferase family 2 protein n=1 Tax=Timonella sp. A28 TaxID=3442640 RepID=UPI003EBC46A4